MIIANKLIDFEQNIEEINFYIKQHYIEVLKYQLSNVTAKNNLKYVKIPPKKKYKKKYIKYL